MTTLAAIVNGPVHDFQMASANTTPSNRKRSHADVDNDPIATPALLKKQRLEDAAASPSTPKGLDAIASAISNIVGRANRGDGSTPATSAVANGTAPGAASPLPPASATPRSRPAIKLSALRGTIWDTSDKTKTAPSKRKATPKRPSSNKPRIRVEDKEGPGLIADPADVYDVDSPLKPSAKRKENDTSAASPGPKGILTPTKYRGPRPAKSVTFGAKPKGEVFFEDLPKTKTPKPKGRPKRAKEDEVVDEIVCAICSRPDSKEPNQIILCEACDFAVHQACYEVDSVPEGEWLCKSCAQEDVLETPFEPAAAHVPAVLEERAVDGPDIPNLDRHLRLLQRVLLDRCAGRRRIKMFGQEEAYGQTRQLVEQTILAGEGNSMLLIGPRGSGKTTVSGRVPDNESLETDLTAAGGKRG